MMSILGTMIFSGLRIPRRRKRQRRSVAAHAVSYVVLRYSSS